MIVRALSYNMPKWLETCLVGIWLLAASPFIAVGFALFAVAWLKRLVIGPSERWRPWFAWYPVRVYLDNEPSQTRWLEIVERQSFGIMNDTLFRVRGGAWEYKKWWSA